MKECRYLSICHNTVVKPLRSARRARLKRIYSALLILIRECHYLQSMPCLNAFYLLLNSRIFSLLGYSSVGLPEFLLPFVIAFEIVGGLFILLGFLTQLTAVAFAGFSIVSALLFHFQLDDQMQFLMFYKNIAMAGGFLALASVGAGKISLDQLVLKRSQA